MAIFSARVAAPAAFAAAASPDFTVPFAPRQVALINEDGDVLNYVEFSYDGVTVHGRLVPTILSGIVLDQQATKIWVRRGAGAPSVQIIAES